jgi:hypothetical protein
MVHSQKNDVNRSTNYKLSEKVDEFNHFNLFLTLTENFFSPNWDFWLVQMEIIFIK